MSITMGAILGGVLPDVSLYVLAGVSIFILSIPAEQVFNELYFSEMWQLVFSIDNSFILWAIGFAIVLKFKHRFLIALTSAALLHLLLDFTLHNDDARVHFWPSSDWRFISPLSYWDSRHHAIWVAPLEGLACAVATVYLLSGKLSLLIKAGFVLLLVAEIYVIRSWILYF